MNKHIVFDANTDPTERFRYVKIILTDIDSGLHSDHHATSKRNVLGKPMHIMDVHAEVVANAVRIVLGINSLDDNLLHTHILIQHSQMAQSINKHIHRPVVQHIQVHNPICHGRVNTGLLHVQDHRVQIGLCLVKLAIQRPCPGQVASVMMVFTPHIHHDHFVLIATGNLIIRDIMQRARIIARCHDHRKGHDFRTKHLALVFEMCGNLPFLQNLFPCRKSNGVVQRF
mmetsp:Transcript_6413/g.11589  ORF Transcript_6413/g.11589 Transcript_6413/m.11589 type:complete len:228 (-) Transcript_6413:93-776(-)